MAKTIVDLKTLTSQEEQPRRRSILKGRNSNLSLISFGLNYNQWDDAANIIVEFLEDITAADIVSQYFDAE